MEIRVKSARVALRSIGKKPKSLEVEAATCAKLTTYLVPGSPAQQQQVRGDERGGLDNDERVEADMVDHLTCESLRSCSPSVHVRGLAPLSASTLCLHCTKVDHLTCESLRVVFQTKVELAGASPGPALLGWASAAD
ncbi:unnamed protein product [Pleuronectes platessa]|uniref:Uncharacterized protein n=1 Tax=Pleuronectes platessa TaxID=8262 RepID=A0A9N7VYK8_PLEPL|nr:unnamed protein product [Pleuronectes platessa]